MKKLLLLVFLLCSCESTAIHKDSDIPVNIVKIANTKHYDTLLYIKDNNKMYTYKNEEYVDTITTSSSEASAALIFGIIVGMCFMGLLFKLFNE